MIVNTGTDMRSDEQIRKDLGSLFTNFASHSLSAALWRIPGEKEFRMVAGHALALTETPDIDKLPSGFLISPFINPDLQHCYFISSDKASVTSAKPESLHSAALQLKEDDKSTGYLQTYVHHHHEHNHADFIQNIEKAKELIKEGKLKKVVLSRTKIIDLQSTPDPTALFFQLADKFPDAFISLVRLNGHGVWIGASPETLVSINKEGIFHTIALAGTQAVQGNDSLSDVTWSQKEIEEQALVGRYIISCFKTIRLREYDEEGPRTVRAGHLLHLQSDYWVDTKAVHIPELATVMLRLLHPTSAVCGMPKAEALEFLQQNEGYQRELFSGFLGPVNINHASHIFVNLRCAQIWSDKVQLFAGAGITKDSDAQKELQETELKMRTIGDLFVQMT